MKAELQRLKRLLAELGIEVPPEVPLRRWYEVLNPIFGTDVRRDDARSPSYRLWTKLARERLEQKNDSKIQTDNTINKRDE